MYIQQFSFPHQDAQDLEATEEEEDEAGKPEASKGETRTPDEAGKPDDEASKPGETRKPDEAGKPDEASKPDETRKPDVQADKSDVFRRLRSKTDVQAGKPDMLPCPAGEAKAHEPGA